MPRIPAHTPHSAPEVNTTTLEGLRRRYGKVLNIHAAMAHSPAVLQSYAAFEQALDVHSSYDERTREAISLAVANQNGCTYCEAAHTVSGARAGLTPQEMISIRRGEPLPDDQLTALLSVAREYAQQAGYVDEATWSTALEAGWTDAELVEVSAHVTLDIFTNYFNHLNGTEGDYRAAPAL